jgi:general stress protein 26
VTKTEIVELLRHHKLAVIASIATDGAPQAALVSFAVSEQLEIIFDTLTSSRKFHNMVRDSRVALVISEGELTIQIEGHVDELGGADLERLQEVYFTTDPDGRDRIAWPDITWLRVRPSWIRVADYNTAPPVIRETHL